MLPQENIELLNNSNLPGGLTDKTYKLNLTDNKICGFTDGIAAIEQAVFKILNTERYKYPAYSPNYGVEIEDLFGQETEYVCAELERRITEALTQDERIESVDDFEFETDKGKVNTKFTVQTIYGNLREEVIFNV